MSNWTLSKPWLKPGIEFRRIHFTFKGDDGNLYYSSFVFETGSHALLPSFLGGWGLNPAANMLLALGRRATLKLDGPCVLSASRP
jgi:hypothetical protein